MSTKGCVGFFLFGLDLELFGKCKKDLVSTHSFFYTLTRDLKKAKKSRTRFCSIVHELVGRNGFGRGTKCGMFFLLHNSFSLENEALNSL